MPFQISALQMQQNRFWHFLGFSFHRLTFSPLIATRQSPPTDLVICNSWIWELHRQRELGLFLPRSWRTVCRRLKIMQVLGHTCRSGQWTRSMVLSERRQLLWKPKRTSVYRLDVLQTLGPKSVSIQKAGMAEFHVQRFSAAYNEGLGTDPDFQRRRG